MKKYNSQFHNSIVNNVRRTAANEQQPVPTNHLTDEQVYDLWEDCYFCEDCEAEILKAIKATLPPTK